MNEITHKVAVLGSGSWATAIMKMLTENLNEIVWYVRSAYTLEHLKLHRHNPKYLQQVMFDLDKIKITTDINEAVAYADTIIIAIPSAFVKSELDKITVDFSQKIVFSAVKGIVPETLLILGRHLQKHHDILEKNLGVIAGPCHAEEVAMERLSYLTIAAKRKSIAKKMSADLSSWYIKTTYSKDVFGIEWAAVLKNVYAIASGIAHGLGYGDNFQAVLISNSIREMKKFIKKNVDKRKRNIDASAYLGDLLVTSYSIFSRNRTFGSMIGKGYTVRSAMTEMRMVAEGYYAVQSAYQINQNRQKNKAKTPIINAVYNILYQNANPKTEFVLLTENLT
jgi:glycerol-3-phosphate dehydrogenase (NAD(P)+)